MNAATGALVAAVNLTVRVAVIPIRAYRAYRRSDITDYLDVYRPRKGVARGPVLTINQATPPPVERPQCACTHCTNDRAQIAADRARARQFAATVMATVRALPTTQGDRS